MITPAHKVRILVATQPVDFRNGFDGLAALVQSALAALEEINNRLEHLVAEMNYTLHGKKSEKLDNGDGATMTTAQDRRRAGSTPSA